MHLHKCDHVNFFTGGGGGGDVRLTAKPRYLLLLHSGNEKSNTVTALVCSGKLIYCILLFSEQFKCISADESEVLHIHRKKLTSMLQNKIGMWSS